MFGPVVDVILPIFGLLMVGYITVILGWFDQSAIRGLTRFVFDFAVPMLFAAHCFHRTAARKHSMEFSRLLLFGDNACIIFRTCLDQDHLQDHFFRAGGLCVFVQFFKYSFAGYSLGFAGFRRS